MLRTNVHIDQGRKAIHDEDSEGHPLRIASEESNEDRQQADQAPIEQLTPCAHRASDIVCGHEDRSEEHPSREELEEWCRIERRVDPVHQGGEEECCP